MFRSRSAPVSRKGLGLGLRKGSGTRLPASLALLLAVLAGVQLLLPDAAQLPPVGAVARGGAAAALANPRAVIADGGFTARGLFAPPARSAADPAGAGVAGAGPAGGAVFAGVVARRGTRYTLVQMPGGQIRQVGVGGVVEGWRVTALGRDTVRLRRGSDSAELPYGQSTISLDAPGEEASFEESDEE